MSETTLTSKNTEKQMNKEKLGVRDYITMALLLVLVLIVYSVVGIPLAFSVIGIIFMHAVCALLWGTVFLLLFTRINKNWVPLNFGVLLGLVQLMNFWPTSVILIVGGLIAEVIWRKMGKEKFSTMATCFVVQITFWYLGIYLPMLVITDLSLYLPESYVGLYEGVVVLVAGPMFFVGLIVTIIGSVAGAYIGKFLLKKHFEKAGLV